MNDPTFVDNQVGQLIDQIDTDSVTPGAITITPGTTTTFSINTPLHSTGFKGFQISGNGLSPFKLSTDPKVSPSTFIFLYVDIYYRLSFTVDALTGTTTFLDAPLSGLVPTVSNANSNINLLGIPWDSSSPAPNSPLSIVITAATPFTFQAGGTLSGIPTTIVLISASDGRGGRAQRAAVYCPCHKS